MQHSKSDVFQRHYLPRYISADTQAAYRGLASQSSVIRVACGMRRSIDPRRPRKLTAEQLSQVNKHPSVITLYRERDDIDQKLALAKRVKASSATLQLLQASKREVTLAYRREKQRQKKVLLEKLKDRYNRDQAVADIQNQLNNRPVDTPRQILGDLLLPERARAVQMLLTLPETTSGRERDREIRAIAALCALCKIKEGSMGYTRASGNLMQQAVHAGRNGRPMDVEISLDGLPSPFPMHCRPTQCFLCVGDRYLSAQKRFKEFYSRRDLEKHLHRQHLRHFSEDDTIIMCPMDRTKLYSKSQLIEHGQLVHWIS